MDIFRPLPVNYFTIPKDYADFQLGLPENSEWDASTREKAETLTIGLKSGQNLIYQNLSACSRRD